MSRRIGHKSSDCWMTPLRQEAMVEKPYCRGGFFHATGTLPLFVGNVCPVPIVTCGEFRRTNGDRHSALRSLAQTPGNTGRSNPRYGGGVAPLARQLKGSQNRQRQAGRHPGHLARCCRKRSLRSAALHTQDAGARPDTGGFLPRTTGSTFGCLPKRARSMGWLPGIACLANSHSGDLGYGMPHRIGMGSKTRRRRSRTRYLVRACGKHQGPTGRSPLPAAPGYRQPDPAKRSARARAALSVSSQKTKDLDGFSRASCGGESADRPTPPVPLPTSHQRIVRRRHARSIVGRSSGRSLRKGGEKALHCSVYRCSRFALRRAAKTEQAHHLTPSAGIGDDPDCGAGVLAATNAAEPRRHAGGLPLAVLPGRRRIFSSLLGGLYGRTLPGTTDTTDVLTPTSRVLYVCISRSVVPPFFFPASFFRPRTGGRRP